MGYFDYLHSGEAGYDPDVICMQEHRTEDKSGECTVTAWLQRQGSRVAYQSAKRSGETGRLSGGVLIAVKARFGILLEQGEALGPRRVSCLLNGIVPGGVRLFSLYQEVGPDTAERRDEALSQCISDALSCEQPFLIGADFNECPDHILLGQRTTSQWMTWQGHGATCLGRGESEIDFFLGHRSLDVLWQRTQIDYLAPTSPHRPVVAFLRGTATGSHERVCTLKQHGKFPTSTPIGCVPQRYDQPLPGLGSRDLDSIWREWCDAAELQLCALHDIDEVNAHRYRGKGRGPEYVLKTTREVWAKDYEMRFPARLRWLRMVRQFLLLHARRRWSAKGVMAWKARLPPEAMELEVWHGDANGSNVTVGHIIDTLLEGGDLRAFADFVEGAVRSALADYSADANKSWKAWARKAVKERGASKAHRFCKANTRSEADTFWVTDAGADERLRVISAVWKKLWNTHQEDIDDEVIGRDLDLITAADVLSAAHGIMEGTSCR
eukprot:366577-Amphidinium_carterae.2